MEFKRRFIFSPPKLAERACEGRERAIGTHPLPRAFAVINLSRFLFSFARSAIIGESRTSVNRLD